LDTIDLFGISLKFNTQITWVLMVPIVFLVVRYFMPKS